MKFKYVAIPEDYTDFLLFCEEYDIVPLGEQSARRGWVDWAGTYLRTAEVIVFFENGPALLTKAEAEKIGLFGQTERRTP